MIELNKIYQEANLITMGRMPDHLCNLIIFSPPYADARKKQYGGPKPDDFLDWIKPMVKEMKRVLAKDGSLIININDVTVEGETHLYAYDLPGMFKRELGYKFVDGFIWVKKSPPPGKFPNRFKDGWEFLYHFANQTDIKFHPLAVAEPAKPQTIARYKRTKDAHHTESQSGSGITRPGKVIKRRMRENGSSFGTVDGPNFVLPGDKALPSNVLQVAAENVNKGHSAVFPVELPMFFIRCLTDEGDVVYDPFTGSGTTGEAALKLDRKFVGSELLEKHVRKANIRVLPYLNKIKF